MTDADKVTESRENIPDSRERPALFKINIDGRKNRKNSQKGLCRHSGGRIKDKSVWKRLEDHAGEWRQALSAPVNRFQAPIQIKRKN